MLESARSASGDMAELDYVCNLNFSDDTVLQQRLPAELRHRILKATGPDFLDAVSRAALYPECTERILLFFEDIISEIAARWIKSGSTPHSTLTERVAILACFAKIFPLIRYLRPLVKAFLTTLFDTVASQEITDVDLESLLLGIFRLLSAEPKCFSELVKPTFLSRFFSHDSLVVRYLAIQSMCIVMRFADAMERKLVDAYVGGDEIPGSWEGTAIDYRLLKLLEEKRWKDIENVTLSSRIFLNQAVARPFTASDLCSTTATVGGVLINHRGGRESEQTSFVATPTALANLKSIGLSLLKQKPVLVTGPGGSGKTMLIRESARLLNRISSMITLHLNEQTDAKSLLGIYTSSATGETFVWQPGVLTKAMQQGRWVLIEDIDRAPSEVLGVLRPVIENGELFLPSRKEIIHPEEGFRIFATIKTSSAAGRGSVRRHDWLTNDRLWSTVEVNAYPSEEVQDLLSDRYPQILSLLPSILQAHRLISEEYSINTLFKAVQNRLPSLRDLLKWCYRTNQRIYNMNVDLNASGMPEQTRIDIFKDGIDCYAELHSDLNVYSAIVRCIAQALNMSSQQMQHSLSSGVTNISQSITHITIGRSSLSKIETRRPVSGKRGNFAMTNRAKKTMDSIAAAVDCSEPLLLVGETGVGKTTQVQHIANLVNQKLTVVNLSQQSEASDLLGGLKPITTRSLIIPLVDKFGTLFDDTFSSKRNEKFQIAISRAIVRENWPRLLLLWQEAIQMAQNALKKSFETSEANREEQSAKRRKLASKYGPLRDRWSEFSSKLYQIKAQVERGDRNHSFAFVEGRLVQAVRSGEWLLLDEINLASMDTLDHIFGLLSHGDDERPSLLLTEAGNIEVVIAHPNFRIFAAMNPATDTGKKDLAPGIRSRFTEIYVRPGDEDVDDLVKIIEAYLGPALSSDRRAASDLAKAYLQLKRLNEENRLSDGAGDVPHFSIRSLVRCLLYVTQHVASLGLRRSMYEGFAMSFFTMLSVSSETLASPLLTTHLLANVKNPKAFLAQQPAMPVDDSYIMFRHHIVLRGTNSPDSQPHYIRTPSVERNLLNLARATSMRRFPILLQGPTSAGKTSMVEYLSKLSGNQFVRINNHEHTDLQEYLGSYATADDGKLEFREGVLVEALRKGHWIVLDELNLAPSDVLEALNRLLDDNRELLIPESQEIVRPHPNFMLFATQNPAGLYGGRKRLSRAFRNRFLELHFDDIPEHELEVILRERAHIAPSFCTQIVQVYKQLSLQRQSTRLFESRNSFATLRDLFRWAARPLDDREQLAMHGFMLLAERVRDPSERNLVKITIETTMKVKIDEAKLYGESTIPRDLQSTSTIVWTSAMRRLFVLVSEALKNNEPVLLVGETGCGKTQICQTIAEAFQRNLNIYNAHSNTETGDLIGSQRPIRQRSELASALLDSFNLLYTSENHRHAIETEDIDGMIDSFRKMDTSGLEPSAVERTRQSIAAYQSLFMWSDGSLVRAMKSGEHFLLDEISLADDSVLERLNSMLEPSRTILLAEKGPIDNLVLAAPGFQFLATMNPGGDHGKRELSAALRNRLTEIWVPTLSQNTDLLPILEAKLGDEHRHFASSMLSFGNWFKDNMQTYSTPTIPLRSLLAWAEFFQKVPKMNSDIAFMHGACMVFIDSLGANPAGLMNTYGTDVHTARKACLDQLQKFTAVDISAMYHDLPKLEIVSSEIILGPFALPRTTLGSTNTDVVFDAPTTLRNTMRIVRALQMYRPILLEGSPGVGKTAIVTALAACVGKSLTRINLSDQTDLMDLFGADAPSENENLGRFSWRDGPLLQAMQTGGWVLLDEMNLASQSVLEGLNSCLDHRHEVYVAELDKSFICHPDFTLFAAQNSHHQGGGRKGLPSSFVNRFTVVFADPFEREDLMLICQRTRPEISPDHLSLIIDTISHCHDLVTQSSVFSAGGPWEINLRDVNRWLDLTQHYQTLPSSHHFESIIRQRFRSPAALTLLDQFREQHLGNERGPSLYHNLSESVFQLGISLLERGNELQHVRSGQLLPNNHLTYAQSVITALNYKWPVILVGSSGCGKTRLIRTLASLSGAKLVEFSMNADVDTMDLIGGIEQYDPRPDVLAVQRKTCELLANLICTHSGTRKTSLYVSIFLAYEQCSAASIDLSQLRLIVSQLSDHFDIFKDIQKQIADVSSKSANSRFTWSDGILIDTLQDGSWLVLDNANLCNPSVLDRLNSLLEPNGVLTISEQHTDGKDERIVRPHPNFRIFLTMDPKHGELSRAMRNRSLELFMNTNSQVETYSQMPVYSASADVYRLRMFLDQIRSPGTECSETEFIEPYIGALSRIDYEKIFRHKKNLSHSLIRVVDYQSQAEAHALMSPVAYQFWSRLLSSTCKDIGPDGLSKYLHLVRQLSDRDQPQMFILNDALIRLLSEHPQYEATKLYARQYLTQVQLAKLKGLLRRAIDAASSISKPEMTVLQQSLRNKLRSQGDAVPDAYNFLKILINFTSHLGVSSIYKAAVKHSQALASMIQDLFEFFNRMELNMDVFHAYVQMLMDFQQALPSTEDDMRQTVKKALSCFDTQFVLSSGQSLHKMWPTWRFTTPETLEQLTAKISIENLLAQFDNVARQLLHRRSKLANIRLRLNIARNYITEDSSPANIVTALSQAVQAFTEQRMPWKLGDGHFTSMFEWVLQKLVIQGKTISELDFQRLSLFTKSLPVAPAQSILPVENILRRLAYLNSNADYISTWPVMQLSVDISTVQSEPLSLLDHVHEELKELASAVSSYTSAFLTDDTYPVLKCIHELLCGLLVNHDDLLTPEARSYIVVTDESNLVKLAHLGRSALESGRSSHVGYFESIYATYLLPVMNALVQSNSKSSLVIGACLGNLCVAALKLLVPDKAFDPATYPAIISQRHHKRTTELQAQIASYKTFQQQFTGEQSSTMIAILEEDLLDLGDKSPAPIVARPSVSELHVVQQEFSTILRSVLGAKQIDDVTSCIFGISHNVDNIVEACKIIRKLAMRVAERLATLNRAYDDVVKPVSMLLESLSFGTRLISNSLEKSKIAPRVSILNSIPLLGGGLESSPSAIMQNESAKEGVDLEQLRQLQFRAGVEQGIKFTRNAYTDVFLSLVDKFYVQWKQRLTRHQAEAEANSRYYAYRGQDDTEQEVNESDLASLFPNYDQDDKIEASTEVKDYDARATGISLAVIHHKFESNHVSSSLRDYILHALDVSVSHTDSNQMLSPGTLLPGLFLQMENLMANIDSTQHKTGLNIYTDSDIAESRKLIELVQSIKVRFYEIQEQWPEHATPAEVLSYSDELLAFKIDEPIAKLLTKAEKLIEIVSQWQIVASREWSVTGLMDSLTQLIIHWRRLELSSWSKLLEIEKIKTEEDADSWYFIAYEAVVYNSRLVVEHTENVTTYCCELARVLEDFLSSTTLGQFSSRLNLLKAFQRTMNTISSLDVRLLPVVRCVAAVLYHYSRYEPNIQDALSSGKAKLEREITEQIKLASWKDTNIQSLRNSARRTHYKLFKIVRKYRGLLAQPLSVFKSLELDMSISLTRQTTVPAPAVDLKGHEAALRECEIACDDWKSRPERLTNPLAATAGMRKLYSESSTGFNALEEITDFRVGITNATLELRKQTPRTLTDENTSLVRHLRERKRRLLAETMRTMVQIGVRRNIATAELGQQSSTSAVLARSFDVELSNSEAAAVAANTVFHEVLDNMPGVRKAAIEHSDDLTEGDVRRATGLLEGLLSLQISQRADLFSATLSLKHFSKALEQLKSLHMLPDQAFVYRRPDTSSEHQWIERCLAWLPHMLRVSCQILHFQMTQGDFDVSELIEALKDKAEKIETTRIELQKFPQLPQGMSSFIRRDCIETTRGELHELGTLLRHWSQAAPNIAYLLEQIVPWTECSSSLQEYANGMTQTESSVLDENVRSLLDSVFVAMQNASAVLSKGPQSIEDSGWIVATNRIFDNSFKSLHLDQLAEQLQNVLSELQHLPETQLHVGLSILNVAYPVIQQYFSIAKHMYEVQLSIHYEICMLGAFLTKTFTSLSTEGFCSPNDPSDAQEQQSGKLESGTGLGEGEGAEDISKDIGDDEDLSELAQAEIEKQDGHQEMDKEKDAIDMGADDIEGATGSEDGRDGDQEDDKQSGSEDEDMMDEEAGSVDDLDPSAIDEKLWDDMRKEAEEDEKEMKGDKQNGQKTDEQTAKNESAKNENNKDIEGMEEADDDNEDQNDDGEGQGRPEAENLDPHLQKEEALELPEEMQLNGEEEGREDEITDDEMDELSDIDNGNEAALEQADDVDGGVEDNGDMPDDLNESGGENDEDLNGRAQDDEIVDDQAEENTQDEGQNAFDTRENEIPHDLDDNEGGDTGTANQRDANIDDIQDENAPGQNDMEDVVNEQQTQSNRASDSRQTGDGSRGTLEKGAGTGTEQQNHQDETLKKLADVLEQYHQRREILTASEDRIQGNLDQDIDMANADFEHVAEDDENADAQALGPASADQVQKLDDSKAIEHSDGDADQDLPMPEDKEMQDIEPLETIAERFSRLQNEPRQLTGSGSGLLTPDIQRDIRQPQTVAEDELIEQEIENDHATSNQLQERDISPPPTSDADAAALWAHCSTRTNTLSILLTEQLRLILAPTTATKLRGDFRTGKRLNIKRIIPYIASGYKRDKIWMRRSVPSKRNYQIMIAVDDSKSMSESGADLLAFETLAMLCKSLSMLEVGELCVVGFGDEDRIRLAHPFDQPFTGSHSGVEVFKHFSFQQRGTDVRKLLRQSIQLFEDARLRSTNDDLWQLQLILSDGHCSDHEAIRRLVRAAHEQKIMIVFVIVDAGQDSIVDLKEAVFEPVDSSDDRSEMKVRTKRYLEGFPFGYYVVVREVADLPGVLARVLRGWFESIVNVG